MTTPQLILSIIYFIVAVALFLDRNVSAPPAMAPDRPALLPDWSMTMATKATATMK